MTNRHESPYEQLKLVYTQVTDAGVAALKARLPDVGESRGTSICTGWDVPDGCPPSAPPSKDPAVRTACIEFILAGLYATDRISRSQQHGRIFYEM